VAHWGDHRITGTSKKHLKAGGTSHRLFGHCIGNTTPQTTPLSATSIGWRIQMEIHFPAAVVKLTKVMQNDLSEADIAGVWKWMHICSGMKMDRTWRW